MHLFHPLTDDFILDTQEEVGLSTASTPLLLSYLDNSDGDATLDWESNLGDIFEAMEDHKGLNTFILRNYSRNDPAYSWLERLLSRSPNITVFDCNGNKCSNGSTVDKLYALNTFYNESAALLKKADFTAAIAGSKGVIGKYVGQLPAHCATAGKSYGRALRVYMMVLRQDV